MAKTTKKNGPRTQASKSSDGGAKRVAIYRRISTDEANQPHSLAAQEADCRRYIAARPGWVEVANIADSASGGGIDRPGLLKVMGMAERREVDVVVFTKLDRLTRRSRDFYDLIEYFEDHEVSITSLEGMIDTTTPAGRMMASLIVAVAQWERETIVERIHRGIRSKVEKGLSLSTIAPFGYEKDPDTKGLVINEDEARIVRLIFRYYAAGAGAGEISLKLNKKGLLRRGKSWDKPTVLRVISCETLAGRIDYDGQMLPAIHEKVIDPALYDKVQGIREARGELRTRALNRSNDYLLSGLISCGLCGGAYVGKSGTSRTKEVHRYYTCHKQAKRAVGDERCANHSVGAEALEGQVIDLILDTYADLGLFEEAIEAAKRLAPDQLEELELRSKMLGDEESKVERALNQWTAAFEEGTLAAPSFAERVQALEARQLELRNERAQVTEEILMLLDSTPELVEVAHYAEMIGRVLRQEGNADEKKRLLRGLIETLVVQPGRTIQPTLRVPRISDLGAKAQEGDGCVVRTQKPLVEVMGFEPMTPCMPCKCSAS